MRKHFSSIAMLGAMMSCPAHAEQESVAGVLDHAASLQKTRGYVSDHVAGGHTHFDVVASDGTPYEICPHPKQGLLHVMQGQSIPGARLVIEINLENDVYPYQRNPFTSLIHFNSLSRSGLRYMADKAMTAIMDTPR
ncbi:hypothetical protein PZ897_03280 [Hoeflea sp. YIM 152468]|uniref:hypothetical protein n=1 Tax=Hoeflea sp. YIM 152468 TaxID=3031759 RepID=UPI0023D9D8FB|nr:hypothetical protein [Hoeflea sp. YIM 152468]MDF1607192.1 hypothetical protein [Hoeflea sp. YIM 152468]